MNARFIESLESRRLLSAQATEGEALIDGFGAAVLELERIPRGNHSNLIGTWKGSRSLYNLADMLNLKCRITANRNGRFTGRVTSPDRPSLYVVMTARFNDSRRSKVTFEGADRYGQISGTGSARLNAAGDRFSGEITFMSRGEPYVGSIAFRRK